MVNLNVINRLTIAIKDSSGFKETISKFIHGEIHTTQQIVSRGSHDLRHYGFPTAASAIVLAHTLPAHATPNVSHLTTDAATGIETAIYTHTGPRVGGEILFGAKDPDTAINNVLGHVPKLKPSPFKDPIADVYLVDSPTALKKHIPDTDKFRTHGQTTEATLVTESRVPLAIHRLNLEANTDSKKPELFDLDSYYKRLQQIHEAESSGKDVDIINGSEGVVFAPPDLLERLPSIEDLDLASDAQFKNLPEETQRIINEAVKTRRKISKINATKVFGAGNDPKHSSVESVTPGTISVGALTHTGKKEPTSSRYGVQAWTEGLFGINSTPPEILPASKAPVSVVMNGRRIPYFENGLYQGTSYAGPAVTAHLINTAYADNETFAKWLQETNIVELKELRTLIKNQKTALTTMSGIPKEEVNRRIGLINTTIKQKSRGG